MISIRTSQLGKYLGVLALLLPTILFSSGIVLTNENLPEVMTELKYLHSQEIGIPMSEVQHFLKNNNTGGIDPSLPLAQGMTDFHDAKSITLSWPAIPEIDKYHIRYLNLTKGTFGSATTSENSIKFELKDDLFLFSFQSQHGDTKGPSWIIIEDKPIAFGTNTEGCRCTASHVQPAQNIPLNGQLLYPIEPNPVERYIAIQTNYAMGNSPLMFANIIVHLMVDADGLQEITLVQDEYGGDICLQNSDTDFSYIYNLAPTVSPGSVFGDRVVKFIFNAEGIYFRGLTEEVNGFSYVSECIPPMKRLEPALSENQVPQNTSPYPNPTSGLFTINTNSTIDAPTEILIKNPLGQNIKRIKARIGQSAISIDLSDFPNDIYYLEIIQADNKAAYPIVKIE